MRAALALSVGLLLGACDDGGGASNAPVPDAEGPPVADSGPPDAAPPPADARPVDAAPPPPVDAAPPLVDAARPPPMDAQPPPVDAAPIESLPECFDCHDRLELEAPRGPEGGALRAVYLEANAGLKRAEPLFAGSGTVYQLDFPDRGRHPEGLQKADCIPCHPIRPDGTGHGLRVFTGDAFAPGVDCAEACHGWLRDAVEQPGLADAVYRGTLRPAALLAAAPARAHALIWREGYARPAERAADIRVSHLGPGCGGCHAVAEPSHGARPTCLRCHAWGGLDERNGAHSRHLGYIRALDVPIAPFETPCGWCHGFASNEPTLSHPVCYTCHLSAHAPSDADGHAQLFPLPQ